MKKNVLGIKIDDVNIDQAVKVVEKWLNSGSKHYIVTPNPEIVMMAQKDLELKKILNQADLAIPDGAGLKLSGDIECITPGIDLMEELIKRSADWAAAVAFLGGREGVAKKTSERLRSQIPNLKITFAESGGEVDQTGQSLKPLKLPKTDLLFVAFGPPKQEKWINKNLKNLDVKVAMGVGGSFDYLSGFVPRAPKWLRNLGLEWLFRLIIQPRRIKRQLNIIKYVLLLILR